MGLPVDVRTTVFFLFRNLNYLIILPIPIVSETLIKSTFSHIFIV